MDPGLAAFNGLAAQAARDQLRACCAATAWVSRLVGDRPYPSRTALRDAAVSALAALDWDGVREALDAHPRIGEKLVASGREAAWSASEQSGMDSASAATRAALVEANRAYEERFGHVLLIFATGKSDEEMLAAARERRHNDEAVERLTVRAELTEIVLLRLSKMLDAL